MYRQKTNEYDENYCQSCSDRKTIAAVLQRFEPIFLKLQTKAYIFSAKEKTIQIKAMVQKKKLIRKYISFIDQMEIQSKTKK